MADNTVFRVSTDYDRQAADARKRRRMADLLAQQVIEPTQYGPGPTPAAAPLVQGLQAFLAARAGRKADEAEEGVASAQARAGEQISNYLFGGGRMPKTAADLTEVTPAGKLQPQTAADLTEVTPEGAYIKPYEKDPAAALRLALTPAGGAAMKGNPMLAAMLAQQMEKPKQLEIGAIDLSKLTPESARRFAVSGNPADIEYRPEAPESRIGKPSFGDFTPRSLEEYNRTGDPNVLVSIPKPGPVVRVSTGGGMGKPPSGYRFTPDGNLEPIKGGPQDPNRERTMPASVLQTVNFEKDKGRRFANIATRADDFIARIEQGKLPLNKISAAQYATERAFDTRRGVTPSEDTPYVQYYELERFVRQQVNAILNLAKGPQTDRDAQRAMEQILDNPDNEKVVLSALRDLKRLYGQETELSNQVVQDYEREFGRGSVAVPGSGGVAPSGIPQSEWDVMTPDERKLFSNPK